MTEQNAGAGSPMEIPNDCAPNSHGAWLAKHFSENSYAADIESLIDEATLGAWLDGHRVGRKIKTNPSEIPDNSTGVDRPDVEAIRVRAAAATPGPWEWAPSEMQGGRHLEGRIEMADESPVLVPYVCASCASARRSCLGPNKPDSEFIAHARTDIPALLAEVTRLEAEVQRMREAAQKYLWRNPAFRSHPEGAPGSDMRWQQDEAIKAEDALKRILYPGQSFGAPQPPDIQGQS